ncbi:hypothetical protein BDA99DRAFT_573372, partial [Phascolomyces articulosus]
MGYITYDRQQWRVENAYTNDLSGPYKRPPIRYFPRSASGPPLNSNRQEDGKEGGDHPDSYLPFRPNLLVRIEDMKVVNGADVDDDYCALSYSWNQSGDLVKKRDLVKDGNDGWTNKTTCASGTSQEYQGNDDDEYVRSDQGKHTIVDFPAKKVRTKIRPRGRRRSSLPPTTRLVKFEGLIQQICLDFGVRYIWYDQMCIDQNDPDQKRIEIKQMHRIYNNALFSIVLVPELRVTRCQDDCGEYTYRCNSDAGINTEWCRRAWTLEEMAMSRLMLYVA